MKNGQSKDIFCNESIYEGCFVKGKRNGKRQLKLSNGNQYIGNFVSSKSNRL